MNKVLRLPLMRMVIAVIITGTGLILGQLALNLVRSLIPMDAALANLAGFILITPIIYLAYRLYVRWIEKRAPSEIGLTGLGRELGLGALLGFVLFSIVIGILWLAGVYHVTGVSLIWLSLLGSAAGALVSAFAQELIFRAIVFRIMEEWLGTWWALAVSALLFGLIHLTQAGASLLSSLAIALQAGLMLAAAYALTHRIWMALGIHFAWDFANDGIFGVGVAGQTGQSLPGLLKASLQGSPLLTGGFAGIEASLPAIILTTAAGVILLWVAFRRGKFSSPDLRASQTVRQPGESGFPAAE